MRADSVPLAKLAGNCHRHRPKTGLPTDSSHLQVMISQSCRFSIRHHAGNWSLGIRRSRLSLARLMCISARGKSICPLAVMWFALAILAMACLPDSTARPLMDRSVVIDPIGDVEKSRGVEDNAAPPKGVDVLAIDISSEPRHLIVVFTTAGPIVLKGDVVEKEVISRMWMTRVWNKKAKETATYSLYLVWEKNRLSAGDLFLCEGNDWCAERVRGGRFEIDDELIEMKFPAQALRDLGREFTWIGLSSANTTANIERAWMDWVPNRAWPEGSSPPKSQRAVFPSES